MTKDGLNIGVNGRIRGYTLFLLFIFQREVIFWFILVPVRLSIEIHDNMDEKIEIEEENQAQISVVEKSM